MFFLPHISILNLVDLVQRYVLHYIVVPRINHVITSFGRVGIAILYEMRRIGRQTKSRQIE